ncbi:peptidase A4 family protein [Penicillium canescens]|nr:peptidase A4 family protein [Penicillium canescens]
MLAIDDLYNYERYIWIDTLASEIQGTYSCNWAGEILENPPPDTTYSYVSATITVPTSTPTDATTYQAASAWVGIDLLYCNWGGLYVIDGEPYTDAWYELYPNFAMYYDEFVVNPGDVIVVSVNVTAPNRGICMIGVRRRGFKVDFRAEKYGDGGGLDCREFDRVRFSGCAAYADEVQYGQGNATFYELVQMVMAGIVIVSEEEMVVTRF